jgi:hypothetical protein
MKVFEFYSCDFLKITLSFMIENRLQCVFQILSTACEAGEFPCIDGLTCVPLYRFCDGLNDCADNSDEIDCGKLLFVSTLLIGGYLFISTCMTVKLFMYSLTVTQKAAPRRMHSQAPRHYLTELTQSLRGSNQNADKSALAKNDLKRDKLAVQSDTGT